MPKYPPFVRRSSADRLEPLTPSRPPDLLGNTAILCTPFCPRMRGHPQWGHTLRYHRGYSRECTSWGTSGGGDILTDADRHTGVSDPREGSTPPVFNGPIDVPARLPASPRAPRSPHPTLPRSVARMPNDNRPAEKRSAWGDTTSWVIGLVVGMAIGISLGIAMDNVGVGIASGAGIGIVFALAFSQSKKSSR